MSLISSWVFFPLVLAAIGLGWGALVGWVAGERELGPLTIPLGLATALIVAGVLTAFAATAPIAAPVAAVGALAGVGYVWGRAKLGPAPALAAIGVLAVYGAPVIASGTATFLGYVRLDDTATWLALIDQLFSHGRSVASLPPSTFELLVNTNLSGSAYPSGAFMLPGIGHWVTGIDAAWIFQPYLACAAAALSLCIYGLLVPLIDWRWLRAFVAFIAAQSALLWGYAAWGGIKELTAAFLLALGVALAADLMARKDLRARNTVSLAIAAAALMVTLGPGSTIYTLPAFAVLLYVLLWRALRGFGWWRLLRVFALLFAAVAVFALPVWLTLSHYLNTDSGSYSATANTATQLGNLVGPLHALQIVGIWPYSDFRDYPGAPPGLSTHILIWLAIVLGIGAVGWTLWRRRLGLALYVIVALLGASLLYFGGSTPWLIGKALAISSPAILLAGLVGGALLFGHERVLSLIAGVLVLGALAGGVLWSNWLQYRNVTLAPRARLSELETIGTMLNGKGPTFFNEYEIYGDRHFLRAGAPVEPAEYRTDYLPTLTGAVLTKAAWADIDSFALSTLAPYHSLVIRRTPVESRPPSIYNLVWSGGYYQLWQQPAHPTHRVIEHIPLGDSTRRDYCGVAEFGQPFQPLCSVQPAAVPSCPEVLSLGQLALRDGGSLLAYERTNPIVLRGTQTRWPASWNQAYSPSGQPEAGLIPTTPGTAVAHVKIPTGSKRYQLWLGGSFGRGFIVDVDGRRIGAISNQLNPFGDGYNEVGAPFILPAGVHSISLTYAKPTLGPGGDDDENYTALGAIVLQPIVASHMLSVKPAQASELCGRSLDWIEVVAPET
jgi:hypothetical protein